MSFWIVPPISVGRHALLLGRQLVQEEQDGGGGIDRHRGRHAVEREVLEQDPHVLQGVDSDTDLADLAFGSLVIGVETHLGREIEGARQTGLAGGQQELEALVRRLGCAETGVLPHSPEAPTIHVLLNASGEGECSRLAELCCWVEAVEVVRLVEAPYVDARFRVPVRAATRRHARERKDSRGGCHPRGWFGSGA